MIKINPEYTRPSRADIWTKCTMMPLICSKNELFDNGTIHTESGIDAHKVLEKAWVESRETILAWKIMKIYPDEVIDDCLACIEYVNKFRTSDFIWGIEEKVPRFYDPDHECTIDLWFYDQVKNELHVFDYKSGWQIVNVIDNLQTFIYLASLLEYLLKNKIINKATMGSMYFSCHIMQPGRNEMTQYCFQLGEFNKKKSLIDADYKTITLDQAGCEYSPSEETCQFCPMNGQCPGQVETLPQQIKDSPDKLPEPETLSDEFLIKLAYENKSNITRWLDKASKVIYDRALNDDNFPLAVQHVEANRQWIDEAAAQRMMSRKFKAKQLYTKKFLSPAQAEKLLKKNPYSVRLNQRFKTLVERPLTKTKLVPREQYTNTLLTKFKKYPKEK